MISLQEKETAVEVRKNAQIALNEKVKAYLESLQPEHTFRVLVNVSRYSSKAAELYINVEYLKENGERDFGSSFDMRFEDNTLKINHGTIGSWDKTYTYQIARIQLFAKMFENIEAIEQFLGSIEEVETICDSNKIIVAYNEEQERIAREEREAYRQTVESSLEVGQVYAYDTIEMKIVKITPKKVYFVTKYQERDSFGKYEDITWKDEFVNKIIAQKYVKM